MKASRKYKLDLRHPLLDRLGFRLTFLDVLFKVVREIAIQVKTSSIVSAKKGVNNPIKNQFTNIDRPLLDIIIVD